MASPNYRDDQAGRSRSPTEKSDCPDRDFDSAGL
jgi:hypothetical protein